MTVFIEGLCLIGAGLIIVFFILKVLETLNGDE
jgi:hypothetical protein